MRGTTGVRAATLLAATVVQACQQENVTSVVVRDVIVEPAQASIVAGEGLAFTAAIVDEQNVLLQGADVTWASEDARVVTITPDGRAEAVSRGETRIVATYEGVTGSASVLVQPPRCDPAQEASGKGKKGDGDEGKGKKGKGGGDDDDDDDGDDDDDEEDDDEEDDEDEGGGDGDGDDGEKDEGDGKKGKDDKGGKGGADEDDDGGDDGGDGDDDPDDDDPADDEPDDEPDDDEDEPPCTPASVSSSLHTSLMGGILPARGGG